MSSLARRFLDDRNIKSLPDLKIWGYRPTITQRRIIEERVSRREAFVDVFVDKFVSDKFAESTTHWRKLVERVHRGVGNPCPLVLIGLPATTVTFDGGQAALKEILEDEVPGDWDLFSR